MDAMDDVAGIWRLLRSVRARERRRLLFFTGVAALVALGQTLGLAGAEALFLTRYGVEYLPHTFIFASAVTILGMLLYAGFVGSTRNDKMQAATKYFGEMAILDDRPRSATVVVTREARLLLLSGESFQDLMLQMPEIAFEVCRNLSSRVRALEAEHQRGQRPMHGQ